MLPLAADPNSALAHTASNAAAQHLLYVLLDSNLPTGGFVSSSGLESYTKHGFLPPRSYRRHRPHHHQQEGQGQRGEPSRVKQSVGDNVVDFAKAEMDNFFSTTGAFVLDAWTALDVGGGRPGRRCRKCGKLQRGTTPAVSKDVDEERQDGDGDDLTRLVLGDIVRLDKHHEASLLSHVARRASRAQGMAMLTLFARGLTAPPSSNLSTGCPEPDDETSGEDDEVQRLGKEVMDGYRKLVRLGEAPGHLAVCWGLMTRALGLDLDTTLHLYLFLHARSLLSSAVRLNLVGPYSSTQLLLHPMRDNIERHARQAHSTTGLLECDENCRSSPSDLSDPTRDEWEGWGWTEQAEMSPATTWPLGEILMARHDLQHSRIFNS